MGEEMTVEQFTKNLVKLIQDPTGPSPEVAEHLLAEALRTARQRGAEEMLADFAEIALERERQITVEGWSAMHDDTHEEGEMLRAAVIYLHHDAERCLLSYENDVPIGWPWAAEWWKPKNRRRNLVRAGALCLAEISRIRRVDPNDYIGHVLHKLNLVMVAICALPLEDTQ